MPCPIVSCRVVSCRCSFEHAYKIDRDGLWVAFECDVRQPLASSLQSKGGLACGDVVIDPCDADADADVA